MDRIEYISTHLGAESDVLKELYRQTHLKVANPHMISGHEQGRLLSMFSRMIRPEKILEIGTFTGYSAICLAEGLAPGGKLYTIEQNDELVEMAASFFEKAGMADRIIQLTGDALEIIPELNMVFDMAFIDAAKRRYADYYRKAFNTVREGGYILIDNILWHDKVVDKNFHDPTTLLLREFNDLISNDLLVDKAIIQNRDGMFILHKRNKIDNSPFHT
ncbi:MAG: O-methyltransferase [Bacteroidales bacterium]|nr:O-methyltransferase [Bacteroidales bacterium]